MGYLSRQSSMSTCPGVATTRQPHARATSRRIHARLVLVEQLGICKHGDEGSDG